MSQIERVATGVPGLDVITHGGLPKGRATLITGRSGTGKSVLALQIACNLARQGINTLMVAIEDDAADLATTGDALGFGFSELVAAGALRVADLAPTGDPVPNVAGEYEIAGLLQRIRGETEQTKIEALVIDSSTALFSNRPPEQQLRRLFFNLVYALRSQGLTSIITAEAPSDYGQLTVLGIEDFVCDVVITIRNVPDGERRRRSIEVTKFRRSGHFKGEYPCAITTKGITVFPLDVETNQREAHLTRFSSGVEGLDVVNNGGWLRDSIVLVRGPTGSGKTMLAGRYALAGALRGERVVYYGFEEPRPMLLRNFAQVGLSFAPFLESGTVQVECRFPDSTSPEDLLLQLRVELEQFRPSLIVIDSVSSIEHATSSTTFRHFMIGLASLLRAHSRSAMLTQTIAPGDVTEHGAAYLSTICDAILMLDYSTTRHQLLRSLRVLKMRGSGHSTLLHQITLDDAGLSVDALAQPAEPQSDLKQLTAALAEMRQGRQP